MSERSDCSFTLLYLFIRYLPVISISEMRSLVRKRKKRRREDLKRRPTESRRPSGARDAMAQIFHHSTNLISRLSIYGAAFILALLGLRAVRD